MNSILRRKSRKTHAQGLEVEGVLGVPASIEAKWQRERERERGGGLGEVGRYLWIVRERAPCDVPDVYVVLCPSIRCAWQHFIFPLLVGACYPALCRIRLVRSNRANTTVVQVPLAASRLTRLHCKMQVLYTAGDIGWTRIPSLASTNTRYRSALSRGLVFFPFVCSILRADRRTFGIVVSKLGLQARGITSAPISPGSCYQVQ